MDKKLVKIIKQLKKCKFKDKIGHKLEMNVAFLELQEIVKHYFSPQKDNKNFCKICGEYLVDDVHIGEDYCKQDPSCPCEECREETENTLRAER